MSMIKSFVLKNLRLNKKRTAVMIIAIILSTALLSALASLVSSFRVSLIEFEKNRNGDFHYVFSDMSADDLNSLESNRAVDSMFVIDNIGYARVKNASDDTRPYAFIAGMDENAVSGAHLRLTEGRMPENANEIAISHELKTLGRVAYNVGDTITLDVGKRLDKDSGDVLGQCAPYEGDSEYLADTKSRTYTITGIFQRPGLNIQGSYAPGYTFVTYEESGKKAASAAGDKMSVFVRYTNAGLRDRLAVTAGILGINAGLYEKACNQTITESDLLTEAETAELERELSEAPYTVNENSWLISYESLWPLDPTLKTVAALAGIVAVIIILTSVYCIKNGFDISISEKTRQYGMLASIGATRKQIKKSVRTEAFILGAAGIPAGILSGLLAAFVLIKICNVMLFNGENNMSLVFHASVIMLAASALLGALTVYLSALGSARRAAKATPLDALRNRNEIKVKPGKLKTPRVITRMWGISGALAYKNMKRNSRKYRTTIVSVMICTVAFISVSYFMSVGMRMVELDAGEADYNIDVVMDNAADNEAVANEFRNVDNTDEFTVSTVVYMNTDDDRLTEKYKNYIEQIGEADSSTALAIAAIDNSSFKKYAESIGMSDENAGAVIVNNDIVNFEDSDGKAQSVETDVFDIKAGDKLSFYNLTENSEHGPLYNVAVGAVTRERPMGFKNSYGMAYVIINSDMFDSLGLNDEGNGLRMHQDICCMAQDADELQDRLESEFLNSSEWDSYSFQVKNVDKSMQSVRSLYTLLAIFTYGFIAVIVLIGITNIINTLGTGMELRRREFATLRSTGMTRGQFIKMIRLESLFISLKSLAVGIPVGLILSYIMCVIQNNGGTAIAYRPPVEACAACAASVIVVIWLIMRMSLTKISRDNIIEAIKNENM